MRAMRRTGSVLVKAVWAALVFACLAAAIVTQPKRILDFDQAFYLTIAHDLDRHRVFSNGVFDAVDSSREKPPSGMFFTPLYPTLIWAVMQTDGRFARAVHCAVEADNKHRPLETCDGYVLPMQLVQVALLTAGVLAVGAAAALIFPLPGLFFLATALASAALAGEAFVLSYLMTESLTFALFSLLLLALVAAFQARRASLWALAGLALALLCLTRLSFLALVPLIAIVALAEPWLTRRAFRGTLLRTVALLLPVLVLVGGWAARNGTVLGKWALSEEYGSAAIIERLAYNQITAREFGAAFPYCLPAIGPRLAAAIAGPEATARFRWDQPNGFFELGRGRRNALLKEHGRLDPVAPVELRRELGQNWRGYLLSTVALGWCGLWAGGPLALLLMPLFAVALVSAVRRREALYLVYAAPALAMLGLHAALANHYTRYNLPLICAASVGAAWLLARAYARRRGRPAIAAA